MTTTSRNEATALAYLDAVAQKDFARCAALCHPDIAFVTPAARYDGCASLVEAFRRIGAIHVRSDVQRVFADRDEVCVIYDFVTDTSVGKVTTVEWLRFDAEGRIAHVALIYDQVPWLTVRQELAQRAAAKAS